MELKDEYLFIKEYYISLIVYFVLLILYSLFCDIKKSVYRYRVFNIITLGYSVYIAYKIGHRPISVGKDTDNYHFMYNYNYESGDFLFDRLSLFFNFIHVEFSFFMTFCALVYLFGTLYGCKIFFKEDYFYAFIIFLLYPYFMLFGINGVRNGMAASLAFLGFSYHFKEKNNKAYVFLILSVFLHLSMIVPIGVYFFRKRIDYTFQLFLIWLLAIILMLMNINVIGSFVYSLPLIGYRFGSYANSFTESFDINSFLFFGIPPILFSMYMIYVKKFTNIYYKTLLNVYLFIHIFYVLLLKTIFAIRIGYLVEFLMVILISYPLIMFVNDGKNNFFYLKVSTFMFLVFMLKAYKILIL